MSTMDPLEFEARAKAAFELIEDKARRMGLYADTARAMPAPDGQMVLVVDFAIGDVAFRDGVQNPEKAGTDDIIQSMEKSQQSNDFLDQHSRMKAALEAGLDPLEALSAAEHEDLGN